jgi:hypothetical protein
MKNFLPYTLSLTLILFGFSGCDKKNGSDPSCNQIILNKPFTAKIAEQWCLDETNWKITFGPFVEDSRCNVPQIECVWAGRYVMAVTINNGETVQDTFEAVRNWSDTLYQGSYSIILNKVFPEVRNSMEPLDPAKYSFEVIVK